jgi:excisionase family DNA binding protein
MTNMKITATIKEACAMTGLGKTKIYQAIGEGKLETSCVGRRRLVNVDSLRQLVSTAN